MTNAEAAARRVIEVLHDNNFEGAAVGGWVRDLLLGRQPKDYDVVTNATPGEVEALFPKTLAIGKKFGVIAVMADSIQTEVATYRIDGAYKDGRRPEGVTYTSSAKGDVLRRDFTINGMLMQSFTGSVRDDIIDYVGGRADLAAKRVRTIGDPSKRFQEDALRMLRAIRFATTLGFEIHCDTWDAIRANRDLIGDISGERVRDELIKILTSPNASCGLGLLASSGLLLTLFPEMRGSDFASVLQKFAFFPTSIPVEALTMFVSETHGLGRVRMLRRLRLPNDEGTLISSATHVFHELHDADTWSRARVIKFAQQPCAWLALNLFEMDRKLDGQHYPAARLEKITSMFREMERSDIFPPALINGVDLLAAGFEPGPIIGTILSTVEIQQLNDVLTNRNDALVWVLKSKDFAPFRKGESCPKQSQ